MEGGGARELVGQLLGRELVGRCRTDLTPLWLVLVMSLKYLVLISLRLIWPALAGLVYHRDALPRRG